MAVITHLHQLFLRDTEKVKNTEKIEAALLVLCGTAYFLDMLSTLYREMLHSSPFCWQLLGFQMLMIFLVPKLTHVAPFKNFISLLFGAFLNDF